MKKQHIDLDTFQIQALVMAVNCVRNTILEDYHSGITPRSKIGDYSDVKVVTPFGGIPWNKLSRISDQEMKVFNIEVVNKIYTYLEFLYNKKRFTDTQRAEFFNYCYAVFPHDWNAPQIDTGFAGVNTSSTKNLT